jgi:uncharacterized protein (DUF2147 family)
MPNPSRLAAAAAAACLLLGLSAPANANPSGTWLTQNGDARIRVAPCGRSICGTVIWIRDPLDPATGRPVTDSKNPDPAQRSRPMVGLRIFAMAPSPQGGWEGPIYNADDGQTYAGRMFLRGPAELEVGGCAGAFCGSEMWSRVGR